MYEVLNHYNYYIEISQVLQRLDISHGHYFLVSAHREENVDDPKRLNDFIHLLNNLATTWGYPVVVSVHPRTRLKLEGLLTFHPLVKLLKPLGFFDYVKLQKCAKSVLSDSGSISEESAILSFPGINLRDTHERAEAMEYAAVVMTGMNWDNIQMALNLKRPGVNIPAYCIPNVAQKVVRIIASYTDYVNRVVWRKYDS